MDTNQKQPILTNTFGKGMNTDTSDALLGSDQYRLARNLRYTTDTEENTGELHMIDGVKIVDTGDILDNQTILKTTELRDTGIIITTGNGGWCVYTFHKDSPQYLTLVFGPCTEKIENDISVVTKYESEKVLKLYIADGKHPVMQIQLVLDSGEKPATSISSIVSTPQIQLRVPKFYGLTYGILKSGLVQYSYRLYRKYGQTSEISPTTKLIQIVNDATIDLSKDKKITGGEYNKTCNCGVKLFIDVDDYDRKNYDSIIIYRIHYAQNGQLPTIENIADLKLSAFSGNYTDDGRGSNEILTLEEYNSNSGIHIIPAVIESKDDYLFAARIKSDTNTLESEAFKNYDARSFSFNQSGWAIVKSIAGTYKTIGVGFEIYEYDVPKLDHDCINDRNDMNIDPKTLESNFANKDYNCAYCSKNGDILTYGGKGVNIDWELVSGELIVDGNANTPYLTSNVEFCPTSIQLYSKRVDPFIVSNDNNWWKHYVDEKADLYDYMYSYANPYTSYLMKSLRRNELYRFGIVFYDKFGTASSVKWIADIRTPDIYEMPAFKNGNHYVRDPLDLSSPYLIDDLRAIPLGIKFKIKNFPEGAVAYEIVRCNRRESDSLNLSQGVLSRPQQRVYSKNTTAVKQDTLTPTGFLTTTNYALMNSSGKSRRNEKDTSDEGGTSDNFANNHVFLFISAETMYNEDALLNFDHLKLDAFKYVYPYEPENELHGHTDVFGRGINSKAQEDLSSSDKFDGVAAMCIVDQDDNYKYVHYGLPFSFGNLNNRSSLMETYYKTNGDYSYVSIENLTMFPTNWYEAVNNHYVYQKLYNSALGNKVYCQPHTEDYLPEYGIDDKIRFHIIGSNITAPVAFEVDTKCCDYDILEIVKANELKWNSIGKEQDGTATDPLLFVGQIVAIEDKTYCNFVSGPLYDSALTLDKLKRPNNDAKEKDGKTTIPIGPAGRCLLLYIDKHEHQKVDSYDDYSMYVNRLLDTVATNLLADEHDHYAKMKVNKYESIMYTTYSSMMGTYICNLKHNVVPYGGNTYSDRLSNTYYSYGDIYDIENTSSSVIIFNGDTFLNPVEYVSVHKCYDPNIINTLNLCIVQSIPLETSINVAMTYGHEFSRNLESQSVVNLQIEPSNVYNKYTQTDPSYVYNSVYSSASLARLYPSMDLDTDNENNNNKDYRCYYSAPKGNNELQDSWLKFLPNNYIDVDTRYGAITHLKTFHNSLVYWQENAVGLFSVNERTTITDDSNLPLILGTGGVLSRYDYIATSNGMFKGDFSDAQSESTLYWWDRNRNEICAYSGGQQLLSVSKTKNVQNYLNTIEIPDDKPCLVHDKKYNEIVMHISGNRIDESIVYSEYIAAFTSLYEIAFNNKIEFSDKTYIAKNDRLFELNKIASDNNTSYGTCMVDGTQIGMYPYLKYIVNSNPQIVKTFDNVVFGGRVYGGKEGVNNLSFTFSTPLKQHSKTKRNTITNREYDFEFAIPRNDAREPVEQWRSRFEERMKGKTMLCELSSNSNSTDFSLQYITTKFRQSWS